MSALQQAHNDIVIEALKNGLQSFVLPSYLSAVNGTPGVGQFRSDITGRAQCVDLTQDLKARFGINRVMTQQLLPQSMSEFGPNGEPVFAVTNDDKGQIRAVGSSWSNFITSSGVGLITTLADEYIEVVFYGTGLNILAGANVSSLDMRASVDGAAEGGNIFASAYSNILDARSYSPNQIVSVASGLTNGLHTVRIRNNNGGVNLRIFGFEMITESSTIGINPGVSYIGVQKTRLAAAQTLAHSSGFESGTLGSRGGRVLVYQKANGSIASAVQPTDASALFLTSASHVNEEIVRTYYWREFGSSRTDDFSSLTTSASTRVFVLDDGVTSLVAGSSSGVLVSTVNTDFQLNSTNDFFTFTFVGTGLDILCSQNSTTADNHTVYIDGTSVGNLVSLGTVAARVRKIASGLPYGTHTVKIVRTGTSGSINFRNFIVYQPKKPSLPAGAMAIADYNVMATYVANSTAGLTTIGTGVLRKNISQREAAIVSASLSSPSIDPTNYINGVILNQISNAGYFEYIFFGTGFDVRAATNTGFSAANTVTLNGLNLNLTNFPSAVFSTYGGMSFSAPTLSYAASTAAAGGFSVSGLPLGLYKLRITNTTGNSQPIEVIDIITPIHTYKNNGPFAVQNTLAVGSQSIGDSREFALAKTSEVLSKTCARAFGVATGQSTSSSQPMAIPDLFVTISLKKRTRLSMRGCTMAGISGATILALRFLINGVGYGVETFDQSRGTNNVCLAAVTETVVLDPGEYNIALSWRVTSGTASLTSISGPGDSRGIVVEEVAA